MKYKINLFRLKICLYLEKKVLFIFYFLAFQELCCHDIFWEIGSIVLLLVDGNFLSILMVYMRVDLSRNEKVV